MFTPNKSDKLIFVNIKNSYEALQRNDTSNPLYRDSLYECTVKYWRIAEEKATSATHILGCYKENLASAATIKKNGGTLITENENYKEGRTSQYYLIRL